MLLLFSLSLACAAAVAETPNPVPSPETATTSNGVAALQSAPAATAYMVAKLEMLDTAMVRVARLETATQRIHARANVIFDGQEAFQSTAKKLADAQESSVETVQRILNRRLGKMVKIFVNRTRTNEAAIERLERRLDALAAALEDVAPMGTVVVLDIALALFASLICMKLFELADVVDALNARDTAAEHAKDD